MRELVGRLTTLDASATESLKIVAYFDELIAAGVGLPPLLRAASFLAGAVVGAERGGRAQRVPPPGVTLSEDSGQISIERRAAGGRVWIERDGSPHPHDDMVLERLVLALDILTARRDSVVDNPVAVAVDVDHPLSTRVAAVLRLKIDPAQRVRVVVLPGDATVEDAHSFPYATARGLVRVALDTTGRIRAPRAGLGPWGRADHLPDTLPAATAAFHLTDDQHPVVDAAELGSVLTLAIDAAASGHARADVEAVHGLSDWELRITDELAGRDSLRATATALGLHHSTVRARHEAIAEKLGWDPRTTYGRVRYLVARMCAKLADV